MAEPERRRRAAQLRLAKHADEVSAERGAPPGADPIDAAIPPRVGGIEVQAAVVLGHTVLLLRDIASLGPGSVIALDRQVDDIVDLRVSNQPFARGRIVVVGDHLGLQITELAGEKT